MSELQFNYKIDESDYHTHLLYTISKSSTAIKTRSKIRWMMTITLLIFSFIANGNKSTENSGQSLYFFILAVLTFIFMPLYTRWSYRKTYLKHVRKFYKDRMSEPTNLKINNSNFSISDSQGESILSFNEIEGINELKNICFLKLKAGQSIILPSHSISDWDNLKMNLKRISTENNWSWNEESDWVWK